MRILILAVHTFKFWSNSGIYRFIMLKGIYPEFQVIRGFSQKIPAGLLSYDQIHS